MTGRGGSPAGRGPAGNHFEGRIGAYYLLALLAGAEPRGLRGAMVDRVRFQGFSEGFSLDDVIVHAKLASGADALLEIQAKRTISFSPGDPVFEALAVQIADASTPEGVVAKDHQLAVATARTSFNISGPYQDVLAWARTLDSAADFFRRLAVEGVASGAMRTFIQTLRSHLVAAGTEDEDEVIWQLLRRIQILEFDFEAAAPLAEAHALDRARQLLAEGDPATARGLWSALIEIAIGTAKTGGVLDRNALRTEIVGRGFRFTGDTWHAAARAKTEELARHALADIEDRVASVHLPRTATLEAVATARSSHGYVELRGNAGVGKSAVLRHLAEGLRHESPVLVLDPLRTPSGGWGQLALVLGVTGTAVDFLNDLACDGGAVLFIDSLEMFTDPAKRTTVNDVLREVARIPGFSVIATARPDFDRDEPNWLARDARERLGEGAPVLVQELSSVEVAFLRAEAPQVAALLADGHPAAAIARNLYRLGRLLAAEPSSTQLRTEAELSDHWWRTADGPDNAERRNRQRLLADLADAAIAGTDGISMREQDAARIQLLGSQSVREPRRDWLAFHHDVLRDWAVAARLNEDPELVGRLPLDRPAPSTLARAVEIAGRLALEKRNDGGAAWLELLARLSAGKAHGSWRRHALLAVVRSEIAQVLLEEVVPHLLGQGGALLVELANAVVAVETVGLREVLEGVMDPGEASLAEIPASFRVPATMSTCHILAWCVTHGDEVPLQAAGAVLNAAEQYFPYPLPSPALADDVARLLHRWLMQLDGCSPSGELPMAADAEPVSFDARSRLVGDLRNLVLAMAVRIPDEIRTYLNAIATQPGNEYKLKAIRRASHPLARAAPKELAALVRNALIGPAAQRSGRHDDGFGHADTDFLPASPAQGPFYELLIHDTEAGLQLIRDLVAHAVAHHSGGRAPGENGFTVELPGGARFFPWTDTYRWSRGHVPHYALASGLMALEAWAHARLDAGEDGEAVLADVLGSDGGCAAYLLVGVDILLSHWPRTRAAAVPFLGCPELLSYERTRLSLDQTGATDIMYGDEPVGAVKRAALAKRPSRRVSLEELLTPFGASAQDEIAADLRSRLERAAARLGDFNDDADFSDPAFMAHHAANVVNPANWVDRADGGREFRAPNREQAQIARLIERHRELIRGFNLDASVGLAIDDRSRGSPDLARSAAETAAGAMPEFEDDDVRANQLVASAMLVARDGADDLADAHAPWVRAVIEKALNLPPDSIRDCRDRLSFNPKGLAASALLHLWLRGKDRSDLEKLLALAADSGPYAAAAIAAALDDLVAADPRIPKALLRCAFATRARSWGRYDEDQAMCARREAAYQDRQRTAIAAELAWLDGGEEPAWPHFPSTRVLRCRRGPHVPGAEPVGGAAEPFPDPEEGEFDGADLQVDTQAAARWLGAIADGTRAAVDEWLPQVISAYEPWTANANGLGLPAEAEIGRKPHEWNAAYYRHAGRLLLDQPEQDFVRFVETQCALPDDGFASTAPLWLFGVDLVFFNGPARNDDRAPRVRAGIAARAATLRAWTRSRRKDELSIDRSAGSIVAALFMNHHNPFESASCYLVPAVFDRVDAMLGVLRASLAGGPIAFVALCTMNLLETAPRARHLDFLLDAWEAWCITDADNSALWIELGIGRRICTWLEAAAIEDPVILTPAHGSRTRLDRLLGHLVALGVPEAHALEIRIATTVQVVPISG